MNDRHRSHLQLQMDILEVIAVKRHDPHLLTQIMYKTAMNSNQIHSYLVEMAMKGFLTVRFVPTAKVSQKEYIVTQNGMNVLTAWLVFKKVWDAAIEPKAVSKVSNTQT